MSIRGSVRFDGDARFDGTTMERVAPVAPRVGGTHSACVLWGPDFGSPHFAFQSRVRWVWCLPIPASPPLRCSSPSGHRSEEHTSELQSLMRISYAVFCYKNKKQTKQLDQPRLI